MWRCVSQRRISRCSHRAQWRAATASRNVDVAVERDGCAPAQPDTALRAGRIVWPMARSTTNGRAGGATSGTHKSAPSNGTRQSTKVRHYLQALEASERRHKRRHKPAAIERRLCAVEAQIPNTDDVLARLQLLQVRHNLTKELSREDNGINLTALEGDFIEVAKDYSERKHISYNTWRSMRVSAAVLNAAGISRNQP